MNILFSFFKTAFLFFCVLNFFAITSADLATAQHSSPFYSVLESQCSLTALGRGEGDDLFPWPFSQCPLQFSTLYGDWAMTLKNEAGVSRMLKIQIISSAIGTSIIKYNMDGTRDIGFVVPNRDTTQKNHYLALMYASSGDLYYLSIYSYLAPNAKPDKGQSCNSYNQEPSDKLIFLQHKIQSSLQCEEDIFESWLLKRMEE